MVLRKATPQDLPDIKKLVTDGIQELGFTYDTVNSERDLEHFQEQYLVRTGTFIVLELKKKGIVGCGGIYPIQGNGHFKIRKMYVPKSQRVVGYGKTILEELIVHVRNLKGATIVLVTSSLMKNAVQLYLDFGFLKVKTPPKSDRCDITMIKKIQYD
jgi:N-acetylglutamate synthase-like GNAT family acetyltransferase